MTRLTMIAALKRLNTHNTFALWSLLLMLLLFILLIVFPTRIVGDNSIYLELGARLLDGERPYIDYYEINPPIIHYLNILPVLLSRLMGLHTILMFNLLVWLLLAASILMIARLVNQARHEVVNIQFDGWLISFLLIVSTVGWLVNAYGQREHLFIIVTLPYLLLRWLRWQGGLPNASLAFTLGFAAALGASLKPMYGLVIVLPELFLLLRSRKLRLFLQPEIAGALMLLLLFAGYAALNMDVIQAYLRDIAPTIIEGYSSYGYKSPVSILFGELYSLFPLALFAVAWWLGEDRYGGIESTLRPFALAGVGALLAYAIQTKGWDYHRVPLAMLTLMILAICTARILMLPRITVSMRRFRLLPRSIPLVASLVAITIALNTTVQVSRYPNFESADYIETIVATYSQSGDPILTADPFVQPIYPTLIQMGRRQVARYSVAYPLAFAFPIGEEEDYADAYHVDYVSPPLAQRYVETFVEDVRRGQPVLILIRNGLCGCPFKIDPARYLESRPEIISVLADYERVGDVSGYIVYTRHHGIVDLP